MNLANLLKLPPWEWPDDADEQIQKVLADRKAPPAERMLAATLTGNPVVMTDQTLRVLLPVIGRSDEPADLRAEAALSLGPVLEMGDIDGFAEPGDPDPMALSEQRFNEIQDLLRHIVKDEKAPLQVRRSALEASVRAPQDWHHDAIRAAFARPEREWRLTGVFAARHVRGFEDQILSALKSDDHDLLFEAVIGAGELELEDALTRVTELALSTRTEKNLRINAIRALAFINPETAEEVLPDLDDGGDREISQAVINALDFGDDDDLEDDFDYFDDDDDVDDVEDDDDEDDEEGEDTGKTLH